MLTSYTSFEEEKISYLRKFAQNIRNSKVLEIPCVDRSQVVRTLSLGSEPIDTLPPGLGKSLRQSVLKSFTVVFITVKGWKIN